MMAVIFAFSSVPSNELPNFDWADLIVKKGGHALGYGLLTLSYLRGLENQRGEHYARPYILSFVFAILYSATDEYHQSFVPGRHPSALDMLIDTVGATTALLIYHKLAHPIRKSRTNSYR